ncbi:MAG: hypothetical protein OXD45_07240 [Rhodobacteraceae bacterium]|nr:hypothetical protein [Paracoccaceae bacterium]
MAPAGPGHKRRQVRTVLYRCSDTPRKRGPDFQLAMGACTAMDNVVHDNQGGRCWKVLDLARLDPSRHPLVQRVAAMAAAGGEMVHDMVEPVGTEQCSLAALLATRLSPLHIGAPLCRGFPRPSLNRGFLLFRPRCSSRPDITSACLAMVCSNSTQTSPNSCS